METIIIVTILVLALMMALIFKRSRGVQGEEIEEVSDVFVTDDEHLVGDLPNAYDDRRVAGEVDEMRSHESDSTNVSYDSGSDSSDSGGDSGGGGGDD